MEENQKTVEPKVQEKSLVEEARQVIKELREANAEKKALLDREERLQANAILGGKSEAGKDKIEIDPQEEAFQKKLKALRAAIGR